MAKTVETPTADDKGLKPFQDFTNDVEPEVEDVEDVEEEDTNEPEDVEETEEVEDDSVDTETEETKEEDGFLEVDFLKKKKKLTKEETIMNAQKGLNYDHVKEENDSLKEKADRIERELNEIKLKQAEQEITNGKESLRKELTKDGYYTDEEITTKINNNPAFKQMEEQNKQIQEESRRSLMVAKRATEVKSLESKPFYKDVKAELENLIQEPKNDNLTTSFMYQFLVGRLIDEGKLGDLNKKTKQSAIADYQDEAKRKRKITSDNVDEETIDVANVLSAKGKALAEVMGVDTKYLAKYKTKQLKRKG